MSLEYTRVGTLSDLEPHGQFSRWVGDHNLLVFRYHDGIKILSNICPHAGGPVGFHKLRDGCFTCLWHNFQFSADDGTLVYPAEPKLMKFRLREYKAKVDGNDILAQLVEVA